MFDNLALYIKYRFGLASAQTQTSELEQACLEKWADSRQNAAEIGVFHGVNTVRIAKVLRANSIMLAIDPYFRDALGFRGYAWARRIAHNEARKVTNARVIWIESLGKEAPGHPDALTVLPIHFLFVDGDHSYEGLKGDWLAWRNHIAIGGIVALHDTRNRGNCGSEVYAREIIVVDDEFEVVDEVDSLTVLRRRSTKQLDE